MFKLHSEYKPTGDLTNNLHGSAGFRTDTQIVIKQEMKKIIGYTKNFKKED